MQVYGNKEEFFSFLRENPSLDCKITEGTNINVAQYLDKENIVRAQAVYQKIGGVVSITYDVKKGY